MGAVRKADFYFGAMLSCLINEGWAPAIIEPGDSSRVYSITTDFGDFQIYAKYKSNGSGSQDTHSWHFQFTPDEIRKIGALSKEKKGCLSD